MRRVIAAACGVAVVALTIWWLMLPKEFEFDKASVELSQEDLTKDYEEAGFDVFEVSLFRETPQKMTGYIKIRPKGLKFLTITKHCNVVASLDHTIHRWCE